jgi:hypothetical protein
MNGDEREKMNLTMPLSSIHKRFFLYNTSYTSYIVYNIYIYIYYEQCDFNIICYEICEKIIIINNLQHR